MKIDRLRSISIEGREIELPKPPSSQEIVQKQETNYERFLDGLTQDILEKPDGLKPIVTTGTGIYIWLSGEGGSTDPKEAEGPPRIVINQGPPDFVKEPAPEGMPYIDLDFHDRMVEPDYYRDYTWQSSWNYKGLIANAVEHSDFSDILDFSLSTTDNYFPRRLYADLTAEEKKSPPFNMAVKETFDQWYREADDHNFRRDKINSAFDEFVAQESGFGVDEVEWRHSLIKRVAHAVKVRKVQRFIRESYLKPLLEAGRAQTIEYVALEQAKVMASSQD